MKKFNTILLSLTMLLAVNLSAQNFDIEITEVKVPKNNASYITGLVPRITLQFTIKNNSTQNLAGADVANLKIAIFSNGTQVGNDVGVNSSFTLAAGARSDLFLQNYDLSAALTQATNKFCVVSKMQGDPDNSNDTSCSNVTVTNATLKVKSTAVSITKPIAIQNELDLGTSVTEMAFVMENNSSVDIPTGTAIPYALYIGSDVKQVSGTLASDWVIGTTTTRTISNAQVFPAIPTVLGPFELCAYTRLPPPAVNDTTCNTYKMVGVAVTSFSPAKGKPGTEVTVNGVGFDPTPANNIVKIGGVPVTNIKSATATKLVIVVPAITASGQISVEVNTKIGVSAAEFKLDVTSVVELGNLTDKIYYSNNILTYELNQAFDAEGLSLKVFNMKGEMVINRSVSESEVSADKIEIEMGNLPEGVYISDLNGVNYKFAK